MSTKFHFTIDALPPSVNKLYKPRVSKYGTPFIKKDKSAGVFEKEAWAAIKKPVKPLKGHLDVRLTFWFKDRAKYNRCDLDNMQKCLFDTLQMLKVIENDNDIVHIDAWKLCGDASQVKKGGKEMVEGTITIIEQ